MTSSQRPWVVGTIRFRNLKTTCGPYPGMCPASPSKMDEHRETAQCSGELGSSMLGELALEEGASRGRSEPLGNSL